MKDMLKYLDNYYILYNTLILQFIIKEFLIQNINTIAITKA